MRCIYKKINWLCSLITGQIMLLPVTALLASIIASFHWKSSEFNMPCLQNVAMLYQITLSAIAHFLFYRKLLPNLHNMEFIQVIKNPKITKHHTAKMQFWLKTNKQTNKTHTCLVLHIFQKLGIFQIRF